MANIAELNEKLNAKLDSLKTLEEKKKSLDEKVSKERKAVEEIRNEIQRLQFAELDLSLKSCGLSSEALVEALKNKDLLSLQEKLESSLGSNK